MIIFGIVLMIGSFILFFLNMWKHLGVGDVADGIGAMINNMILGVVFIIGLISAVIGAVVKWLT